MVWSVVSMTPPKLEYRVASTDYLLVGFQEIFSTGYVVSISPSMETITTEVNWCQYEYSRGDCIAFHHLDGEVELLSRREGKLLKWTLHVGQIATETTYVFLRPQPLLVFQLSGVDGWYSADLTGTVQR